MIRLLQCATVAFLLLLSCRAADAQQTGLLYDPEPPANAAYVRVVVAAEGPSLQLMVDGKPRGEAITTGAPSEYLVLPAGPHHLQLKSGRQVLQTTFEAPAGKALTLAFLTRSSASQPLRFEDKANTNKLKAVLTVYHLAHLAGPLDVTAGTSAQTVFPAVAAGASVSRLVNPLNIRFGLAANGKPIDVPAVQLAMEYGGTYSVFIFPGKTRPQLMALLNRVERYTGTP